MSLTVKFLQAWLSRENLTIFCNKIHERSINCSIHDKNTEISSQHNF